MWKPFGWGTLLPAARIGLLRRVGQRPAPVGGDDHGVLDADPAVVGEVHPGLDRHDVARRERGRDGPGDPRVFVDLEADAVAGAVGERVRPAGVAYDGPAGLVDLHARRAGPH